MPDEDGQSPEDRVLAALDLNRYLRPTCRLSRNRELDASRQAILESAIGLAKQAMTEPNLETDWDTRHNFYETTMYPSAEFLHLMLYSKSQTPWRCG